ncbi:hypothetical protein FBALC1_14417 [Flavobacteriales bacterium ALC-1]|nr:hypothetical protein FBALC1_14417 [Flavobacteriales bacterium ALC-1]
MKNLFFIITLVLWLSQIEAQNYDFGKISKAELEEKYHPQDSSAHASILYRNEAVKFSYTKNKGFMQEREVHVRIKIYDKEGFDWASKKVFLYKGGNGSDDQINGLKGFTYNLEKGKINKDKLKSNGVFEEKVSEFYEANTFTLPNVKEGSVLEYKYMISSQLPLIDDIELQFSIPIKKLNVRVATPKMYRYNKFLNPKASYVLNYKETINPRKIITTTKDVTTFRPTLVAGDGTKYKGLAESEVTYGTNTTDYHDNVITFSEENIPSLKAESFAGSINNYKAKLSMEFEAYLSVEGVVKQSFASSWEKVSKNIFESSDFGGQLTKSGFFKDDLNALVTGIEDDFQKAFLVENLVKSKVKWNGTYGKYAQKGIRSAYKEGEGNVADINLLVTAMLRSKGVNASPVLISTRNNGVPLFPTREGFNYVICMVQSGSNYMLIDATEPYSTNNVLPERALNWQGRVIVDKETSRWVNIKSNKKSVESTMLNVKMNEDLTITGKVRKNYTSYLALNYRKKYTNLSMDDHIKSLETGKGDVEISELIYENDKDISKPVKITYDYELSDGVDEIGDKLYFSPLFFLATKESPFKLEERKYPIDFVIPFADKYKVNIMLPEGYKVESLPENGAMEFKGGEVKFTYVAKVNGKYLQLSVQLEINNPIIQPIDYKDFKEFFNKTIEKQAEQIVLIKA